MIVTEKILCAYLDKAMPLSAAGGAFCIMRNFHGARRRIHFVNRVEKSSRRHEGQYLALAGLNQIGVGALLGQKDAFSGCDSERLTLSKSLDFAGKDVEKYVLPAMNVRRRL